ncbi:MAG: membrane protein insertase YidC [Shewanellaceae bacterium]|nr:membrane protein insertase YidC [Shewanellaceae bacterium]
MESQRNFFLIGLIMVSIFAWLQWTDDKTPINNQTIFATNDNTATRADLDIPENDISPAIQPVSPANLIDIKTDTFHIKINPQGGDIVYAALKQHKKEIDKQDPFVMLNQSKEHVYIAQSGLIGEHGIDKQRGRAQYTSDRQQYILDKNQDTLKVTLYTKINQVNYQKIYTFTRNHHDIHVAFLIQNNSLQTLNLQMYGQLKETIKATNDSMMMPTYTGAAYSTAEQRFKKYSFEDMQDENLHEQTQGGWVALLQHYFVSAWVPDHNSQNKFYSMVKNNTIAHIGFRSPPIQVAPKSTEVIDSILYIGPKNQADLEELSESLNLVVDYGFLWWLAIPIHALLTFFQSITVNWGLAIILITLTVRMLLFPLTKAQYVSMAKMRNLQPQMQKLKERFGEDRQKMGQAMMELYRKEKVNPMGGCLPMLLQMPIFIALYWVLLESVELRHTPFVFWIKDLSVQDPYYVLPLLMGLSAWVMQKLQPAAASLDPMQQKVMQYMPVMFTIFFLWFPSGLVLYWLIGNIVAIGQQLFIYRSLEKKGLK